MGWRRIAVFTLLVGLGWLDAEISSTPSWVQMLYFPADMALFVVGILYVFDPDWGRKYPRRHKRMMIGGAVLTLFAVLLFLLFGELLMGTVIGRGNRSIVFLLFLSLFVGTVLFVKQVIAGKWNGW
jgi:hypothetical protein